MNEYNPHGKDIRFIDSHYKDLFRLPDGGSIRITYADGESAVRKCTYIDEYHTMIGNNVFHICQFAELMERNGSTYQPEKEEMLMSQEKIERWDDVKGNDAPQDKLTAFLDSTTDAYAILQLRRTDETVQERFESLASLHRQGKEPEFDHYEVIYAASLPPYKDQAMLLEGLYEKFNVDHPADFRGHSLSVSDIVALKTNAVVSFHYVDSIGFQELPAFMKPENYLKNAEMAMEDDYGMIDGIINNGKAPQMEETEKKSVLEQLKKRNEQDIPKKPARTPTERNLE